MGIGRNETHQQLFTIPLLRQEKEQTCTIHFQDKSTSANHRTNFAPIAAASRPVMTAATYCWTSPLRSRGECSQNRIKSLKSVRLALRKRKKTLAGDPVGRQSIGAVDTPQAEGSVASVGSGGGLGWGCLGAGGFRRRSSWNVHGDIS